MEDGKFYSILMESIVIHPLSIQMLYRMIDNFSADNGYD